MKIALALCALSALALAPAPAAADKNKAKADQLFTRGKEQLARKQYSEACATFEKVDELDPAIGAKLNVARCYEEWGKLARAYRWYSDAEKLAKKSGDDRAPKIQERIEKIDPDIPRLTIKVGEGADLEAAAIKLDDEAVAEGDLGRAIRIDPGPHDISYRAGGEKKTKTIAIERKGSREVRLELGSAEGKEPAGPDKDGAEAPAPGRGRRIAAYSLLGAAAVGLGVSTYLAIDARSDYRAGLDTFCMGAKDMCTPEGLTVTHDARSQANLATVFAIVGAAAAAGGVVLYLTAPSSGKPERLSRDAEALYLAPVFGDRAGMVVLGGRY